ncbi:MAG: acyl-ACP--UDP-N-acetylglucosamine O-acyltransferase, partial [Chthoniobacterales bacterium]
VNLVGLERNGFAPERIKMIKEAFRLIYRCKYNTRQGVEAVRKELPPSDEITRILEFIETSERGIIR